MQEKFQNNKVQLPDSNYCEDTLANIDAEINKRKNSRAAPRKDIPPIRSPDRDSIDASTDDDDLHYSDSNDVLRRPRSGNRPESKSESVRQNSRPVSSESRNG